MVQNLFSDLMVWDDTITIIDPGCGCGIFLVSAIEYIHERFQISIKKLLRDHIFGIDINKDNVRRCKLVMRLLTKKYGEEISEIPHIVCKNSLKERWKDTFHLNQRIGFSYVIGNPPYVNPHDLSKDTIEFLKNTFETTVNGTFNIFYAFIEHAMDQLSEDGRLGFIVPNNFLTIKSA
ncbi:MAG: N-6 DNA methylase [Lachnospiraceae bacterium]